MTSVLLRSRLRWYAVSTGRLLLRRWQALLLALAVLAPAGASALSQVQSLGWPVLALLAPEHGSLWRFCCLCLYQALAMAWVLMQRDQVTGGDFMGYARSLPVPPRQARAVDMVVLLAANSPLLLLPAAALVWVVAHDGALPAVLHGLFVVQLVILAAAAQLACVDRRYARLGALALANIPLAAAPGASPAVQVVLLAATLPCAWLADRYLAGPLFGPLLDSVKRRASHLAARAAPARLHPAAFIPLNYLVRQAPAETFGKLAVAGVTTAAALALMAVWEYDDRIGGLSVIALAIVALAISGLYRDLHTAHRAALPLVAGLPLPRHWARKFDHMILMLAGLPFAAIIGGVVVFHQPQRLVPVLLLAAAFIGLVGLLRLPQVHGERQAVVLGTVIAALWGTACAFTLI
ncbi:hypothetical protein [Pseudoduganella umbonata]|uniref:Uncharacterized protein n=1 Tax=Pseudoduganella umbonata TaxID=864828 RepID=A0A4P8HM23_9BURK|nr:hypothetical protein [Pseudoduganella umbonata]MBB3219228.1 hypothetical protein [Pseudoduganella umbonata]QCP09348.1 hypothetical protein FCL38_02085 [Pseudoduganella umbonata]